MGAETSAALAPEVGSELEWADLPTGPIEPWPESRVSFALAQHGLIGIWRHACGGELGRTLWVPDYFCPTVIDAWRNAGVPLAQYSDDPRWCAPEWESLRPAPRDLVLACNYFGLRSPVEWERWKTVHEDVVLVEDHSHDPVSEWARNSSADYGLASLRKTMPVPDGAMVWSPRRLPLPPEPSQQNWTGSALKLTAMRLKRDYLAGKQVEKGVYRAFATRGEAEMLAQSDLAIAPWSAALLGDGFPSTWRQRRRENFTRFIEIISGLRGVVPLTPTDLGASTFNPVLVFDDHETREAIRNALLRRAIYPAVHWAQRATAARRVRDLSERILTIPLDQRYGPSDVDRVAYLIVITLAEADQKGVNGECAVS